MGWWTRIDREEEKERAERCPRGAFQFELHEVETPCIHALASPSFTHDDGGGGGGDRTHVHHTLLYEAKRRERGAHPYSLHDNAYPPDLQLRSPMPRTKSLHALSRPSKSIDTYTLAALALRRAARVHTRVARRNCIPRTRSSEPVEQGRARANNAILNNEATVV